MVRIGISVEGATEEQFVKKVLAPYLAAKSIFIDPINMGGKVNVDRVKSELRKIAYGFDYVTTFYDFYGFQGLESDDDKLSLENKIKSHVHESVKNKLIPYIQMYEFEGLLFSCPDSMQSQLGEAGVSLWAKNILNKFNNNPEAINNSFETAPSKRLAKKVSYRKMVHGPNIAEEIGIEKIRSLCPGFDEWLTKLEDTMN